MKAPELLNRHEAANYLGLSVATLDNWRYQGCNLPYAKYANQVRYKLADLDAFIQKNTRGVAAA